MTNNNFLNREQLMGVGFVLIEEIKDLCKKATSCERWERTKDGDTTLVVHRWPEVFDCTMRTVNSDRLTCAGINTLNDLRSAANFYGVTL